MANTAAEKVAGSGVVEKKEEKVEKRRALGRGLASLLPGPRVVGSPESRVPGTESGAAAPPFPAAHAGSEASAEGSGAAGGQQVPRFARNDKDMTRNATSLVRDEKALGARNDTSLVRDDDRRGEVAAVEPPASQELDASRTGVSDPYEPVAALAAGQPRAAVPTLDVSTFEPFEGTEVISIQAVADDRVVGNRVAHLPLEAIDKNPYQTRYVFDEKMLWELRDSIKEHGVVQPIVVRPAEEEGRYILVLGERRLRASKMAEKETIPALVRRLSPQQAAEMTVLENVVREDLNAMEQAEAFRVLSTEFKLTQAQIAERIGVSRETVSNYMRLLRLPRKVMDYMLSDRLSFSDAREILRLEKDEYIEAVAEEVVTHKLKWDQIEDRVMRINGSFPLLPGQTLPGAPKKTGGARWMDPNVRAAQTDMERTLGMRVRIRDRHGKGKIVIEYASVDDYERVTGMLRGKK
jgi:ParB family transcriptional regulator, chromosome partitioning protein